MTYQDLLWLVVEIATTMFILFVGGIVLAAIAAGIGVIVNSAKKLFSVKEVP